MKKKERQKRIIARGEHSNHCHVVVGDAQVYEESDKTVIEIGENQNVVLKHLLEKEWLGGDEIWTKEHHDIDLNKANELGELDKVVVRHGDVALKKIADRKFVYIAQEEYDPFDKLIRRVID